MQSVSVRPGSAMGTASCGVAVAHPPQTPAGTAFAARPRRDALCPRRVSRACQSTLHCFITIVFFSFPCLFIIELVIQFLWFFYSFGLTFVRRPIRRCVCERSLVGTLPNFNYFASISLFLSLFLSLCVEYIVLHCVRSGLHFLDLRWVIYFPRLHQCLISVYSFILNKTYTQYHCCYTT